MVRLNLQPLIGYKDDDWSALTSKVFALMPHFLTLPVAPTSQSLLTLHLPILQINMTF